MASLSGLWPSPATKERVHLVSAGYVVIAEIAGKQT
jgi:hypothetical protein